MLKYSIFLLIICLVIAIIEKNGIEISNYRHWIIYFCLQFCQFCLIHLSISHYVHILFILLPRWLSGKFCPPMQETWVGNLGGKGGEENGNPLHYSCLGNPMDRGAWWATVSNVGSQMLDTTHTHTHCLYYYIFLTDWCFVVVKYSPFYLKTLSKSILPNINYWCNIRKRER